MPVASPDLQKSFVVSSLRDGQKVILITIGLSDPDEPEKPTEYSGGT